MNTENLTSKQVISIMVLFICGGSLMFGTGKEAKADLWLALIIALLWALVAVIVYTRILSLFPEKDLFDIAQHIFGKFIGNIISLLYIWFCFHLSSLILYDYIEFMNNIGLDGTPKSISVFFIVFLVVWIVRGGMQALGIWCELFVIVVCAFLCFTILLMLPFMNIKNLHPFLYEGINPVIGGAFSAFSFPFAETVVFMGIFNSLKSKNSYYKTYIKGLLFGGVIVFLTSLSELLVLGENNMLRNVFPSYVSLRIINIKDYVTGIEIIAALLLIIGIFVKSTVCFIVACKGISKLFHIQNYKLIIVPVCILSDIVALSDFQNIMELIEWDTTVWRYYAFLFQVILPIIILIGAEIKVRLERHEKIY